MSRLVSRLHIVLLVFLHKSHQPSRAKPTCCPNPDTRTGLKPMTTLTKYPSLYTKCNQRNNSQSICVTAIDAFRRPKPIEAKKQIRRTPITRETVSLQLQAKQSDPKGQELSARLAPYGGPATLRVIVPEAVHQPRLSDASNPQGHSVEVASPLPSSNSLALSDHRQPLT